MDKFERIMKENLSNSEIELDVESVLAGTHRKIRGRATRRKVIYSSPVAILLLVMIYAMIPGNGNDQIVPGGELFLAGWENTWTEIDNQELIDYVDQELYDQSVDYLVDEQATSYVNEMDEILDENDLEAFVSFLKEA